MIDLSNLKAPGWQRIVADLASPAPDDHTFHLRLVSALAQVSGARQGVVFMLPPAPDDEAAARPDPRPALIWPLTPELSEALQRGVRPVDLRIEDSVIEQVMDARNAAKQAAGGGGARVFGLEADHKLYYESTPEKGFLLAVPVPGGAGSADSGAGSATVITLLLDARSRQALQTTLALVEVLAGYAYNHTAQQALRRTRQSGAALDLAARLIAAINNARGFKGATLQLVNDLCRQLGVDRVALGWIRGGVKEDAKRFARVVAMSDTENIDRRMAMVQKLEAAMDECLDQEQAVLFPPPASAGPGGDAVLSQAIIHSHRELAASDAKLRIASLPMRVDDRVVGVVLLESSSDQPIDVATIELIQAAMDLVAPVLEIRRSDDRWIASRTWDWAVRTAAWAVGPKHTVWKAAGLLLTVAFLSTIFIRVPYRVGATMELQAREQRTVSMPFDGRILALGEGVEAGKKVNQGDVLVELDATELKLQAIAARSQIVQAQKQADEALKKGDTNGWQEAEEKVKSGRAQLELAEHRIEQSVIRAPISGTIIGGDLRDRVLSSLKLGEPLFLVADLSEMEVKAKVSDRDISLIKEGTRGEAATKGRPDETLKFTVERVVPLAQPEQGANAFEARGRIEQPGDQSLGWIRPGMEGVVRLETKPHSLLWIGTRRIMDQLRLWLWW